MKKKNLKISNKRLIVLMIILSISIILLIVEKLIPSIMYTLGVKNYEAENYEAAYRDLGIAVGTKPSNKDYRYYYVETMLKLPPTLEIQKNIYDISRANIADSADLIADRQL